MTVQSDFLQGGFWVLDSSCQICEQVISPTEPPCQLRRLIFLRVDVKINAVLFVKKQNKTGRGSSSKTFFFNNNDDTT